MTAPTPKPPCLGEREAVARGINPVAFACGPELYGLSADDHEWRLSFGYGAQQVALVRADAIIAEHIAPLRTENETLRAERDEAREVVAFCNNSFGSYSYHLNPHPAWQIEKVKEQARSEWQRAEAAEAQLVTLRAERDAAIARAEEAERRLTFGETTDESVLRNAFATGAQWAEKKALPEAAALTTKLAQAKGEIATMRAALVAAEDALSDASSGLSFNDTEGRQNAGQALQDLRNVIARFEEHPHGD